MSPGGTPNRAAVEADQLDRLRALIAELTPGNRFYAPRLEAAGLSADLPDLAAFRERMPFTSKAELVEDQQAHPPFGRNLTYPLDRYTRFHQTSATTGSPMRCLDTPESWQWLLVGCRRVYEAAGVRGGERVLFAFSFGPFLGFWLAFEAAAQHGCLCIPAGGLSSRARLRMILDNRAEILCCTPTYAGRLAEVAEEEGFDLSESAVRTVIVAGEPGGSVPAVRQRIVEAWGGAAVFDHHGMTEMGPVTYEHPNRPGTLRIIESAYLAEAIDPETHEPIEPRPISESGNDAATGELVLTTLGRFGSPLLRYRTGDLVKPVYVGEDGGDGPHLALEGGILDRIDDMITVRGVNVYPSAVDQIIRRHDCIAEYRVDVDTSSAMTEMSIAIEPGPDCSDGTQLAETLKEDLRASLSLRVPVQAVEPNTLPRFEMKARRWVRSTGG
jgi:phenylacetate-CoA ligase